MKRKTLLKPLLLITIFTVFSNGQTHIKDLIEITPKQNVPYYQLMKQDTAKFVPFRYDESMGKELIEERTLYRKVFLQPDGTKKARIYASPIHFEDENSNMQDMKLYNYLDNGELQNRYLMNIYNDIYDDDQIVLEASCSGNIGSKYAMYSGNNGIAYKVEKNRALIKFPVEQVPTNANIINADFVFDFYRMKRYGCVAVPPCPIIDHTGRDMAVNIVLSEWGFSETTGIGFTSWDGWGQFELDFKSNYEDFIHLDDNIMKTSQSLNVTEAVKNWTDGTYANNGLLLWATDEDIIGDLATIGCWGGGGHVYREFFLDVTYTDKPVEPKLKIVEPNTTSNNECILPYLDENLPPSQIYPIMPQVTCKAVFDGLNSLTSNPVDVNWEYIVEFDFTRGGTYRRNGNYNFSGISQFSSSTDTTNWLVSFTDQNNDPKYIGGNITIIASTEINGTTYSDTLNNVYEILGQNPTPDIARLKAEEIITNYGFTNKYNLTGIKYKIWTILYEESKFRQFEWQDPFFGYPEWGYPKGMGVGQLDNPEATPEQLWDWVDNLNAAINLFKKKIGSLNRYVEQVNTNDYNMYQEYHNQLWGYKERPLAPDFNTYQASINWHQLYNYGHYWVWAPIDARDHSKGGKWEASKILDNPLGEKRYQLELQIINSNYPEGWFDHEIGCE